MNKNDEEKTTINNGQNDDEQYLSVPMFEEFSDQDLYPTACNDLFGVIG